jgi:hypothetical protein
MPTHAKIPKKIKKIGATASGGFVVFGGMLSVGPAMVKLQSFKKAIPAHGHLTIKGRKYWYCRYGLVDDPDIYAK